MTATTPLWVTVLLAVLAPVLTLVGVLWTQRAADRRAVEEATMRLDHDLQMHKYNQRRLAYEQIMVALRPYLAQGEFPGDEVTMSFMTQAEPFFLFCSNDVQVGLDRFSDALQELNSNPDDAELDSRDDILGRGIELTNLMRKEMS